ncbi:MAG: ECF transporter S component [Nitrososphaerota archaeon]|nr:ECF transporter S component [Candidatus Bathyarchaeota archaeon]MDW8022224.1 ECF transporter S component [Nitrososphaerota archaeon]
MKEEQVLPASLNVILTALCAALYAVGAYSTAYIPSPWGFGQFRPAVVIPSFFAVVFGPWVGGIGAALGTLICDSVKHGTLHMGSLIAAVPGNFIGFFILGYMTKKKFTWERFIVASYLTLAIGNLIVAFLYIFLYKVLYTQTLHMPVESLVMLSIGLTIFWFITMLPFSLTITPVLIRVVTTAFPGIVSKDIRAYSIGNDIPKTTFSLALAVPGLITLATGLAIAYTPFGGYLVTNFPKTFTPAVMELLQILFYICGAALTILGVTVLGAKNHFQPKSSKQSQLKTT